MLINTRPRSYNRLIEVHRMGSPGENAGVSSHRQDDASGVLLYYKFVDIPDPPLLKDWFTSLCSSHPVVGRIRIAPAGINVTVGGTMSSLNAHIKAVYSHPLLGNCDFKLAAACSSSFNSPIVEEVGFSSFSVRVVKELVTLGLPPLKCPSISDAGMHLSAAEFHRRIDEAAKFHSSLHDETNTEVEGRVCEGKSASIVADSSRGKLTQGWRIETANLCSGTAQVCKVATEANIIVLDVRNIYETRIGRFVPPPGVEYLEPKVRQYSDLPGWIDSNADQLTNKCILMYCTGGVRCEMASAYLKNKGKGFENVFQLSGGIQRYLEAFPDGGYFKGKNFVFDHRMAVASSCTDVIGSCMTCGVFFDDYSSRSRCTYCRMLVLICSNCQANTPHNVQNLRYTCELCRVGGNSNDILSQEQQSQQSVNDEFVKHNRKEFCSGKTTEKQPDMLDMEREARRHEQSHQDHLKMQCSEVADVRMATKKRLKVLCLHGFRQNASNLKGRLASFTKKLRHIADFVYVDAPHEVPMVYSPHSRKRCASLQREFRGRAAEAGGKTQVAHKKFAWLITPDMLSANSNKCDIVCHLEGESVQVSSMAEGCGCQKASQSQASQILTDSGTHMSTGQFPRTNQSAYVAVEFDRLQYRKQTAGWSRSLDKLRSVFCELGPFDGLLGFSQGAAMVASLCLVRECSAKGNDMRFGFVILCSGFLSLAQEHLDFMSNSRASLPLDCPSLHIFGETDGCDRQISTEASSELVSLFKSDKCVVLKHKSGHIVPTQKEHLKQAEVFLNQFL